MDTTKRLAKLATMMLLITLGLMLFASDSMGSMIVLDQVEVELKDSGDLQIKGSLTLYEESDVVNISRDNLRINARIFMRVAIQCTCDESLSQDECDYKKETECFHDELVFKKDQMDFTLNPFEIILENSDIKIKERSEITNYRIELDLRYEAGDTMISSMEFINYQYIPEIGDLCKDQTCSGHGNCSLENGQPKCTCDEGYAADNLQCIEEI